MVTGAYGELRRDRSKATESRSLRECVGWTSFVICSGLHRYMNTRGRCGVTVTYNCLALTVLGIRSGTSALARVDVFKCPFLNYPNTGKCHETVMSLSRHRGLHPNLRVHTSAKSCTQK